MEEEKRRAQSQKEQLCRDDMAKETFRAVKPTAVEEAPIRLRILQDTRTVLSELTEAMLKRLRSDLGFCKYVSQDIRSMDMEVEEAPIRLRILQDILTMRKDSHYVHS